jgi:hypothetical protein
MTAINSPTETTSAGRGPTGLDGMSATDARCAPVILGPNKDLLLVLIIITTLMPLLSFMVMEVIPRWKISLIATSMIAFIVAAALPPCYIMRNFGTYFTGPHIFLLVPCKIACCTILLGIKIPILEIQSHC